ncbi:hypothetical protein, partial [Granulicella mallensis]|uniref:hypothetical protein n=1 Tax=Granulicella mallensis TaxID=940614 RepID=UPI001C8517B6
TALHPQKQRLKNPLPSLQEQTRSGNTLFPQPVKPCRQSIIQRRFNSAEGWSEARRRNDQIAFFGHGETSRAGHGYIPVSPSQS